MVVVPKQHFPYSVSVKWTWTTYRFISFCPWHNSSS